MAKQSIKGMIFAAGIGSRLKPWTDKHPKALVEIAPKQPAIANVIENMRGVGIAHIIINVHHFASQIIDFVNSRDWGVKIDFSDESDLLLDTGGGLKKALPLIGDSPVLIHNADILTTVDLSDIIAYHFSLKTDATLLTAHRSTSRYLLFDKQNLMHGWTNISTGEYRPKFLENASLYDKQAFGGIHVINPSLYSELDRFQPLNKPFSIMDFYISKCSDLALHSFLMDEQDKWFDMGRPETLEKARIFYKTQK